MCPASLKGAFRIKRVVTARIREAADVATAIPGRFSNRKMMAKRKSGLAYHATYENPKSRQTKPRRKLESPRLNINVLKPSDARNSNVAIMIPETRSIGGVFKC